MALGHVSAHWVVACVGLALLAAALTPAPAAGADQTVGIVDTSFVAARVAVKPGESVRWTNATGGEEHNVHFEDHSFVSPEPPKVGPWDANRTFASPGVYPYYCEVHGRAGGTGMSGIVYVNADGFVPPAAALELSPAVARVGQAVTFSAVRSVAGDRPIVRYRWDLDGDGDFERDTGTLPTTTSTYSSSSLLPVRLRVTDDAGLSGEAPSLLRVTTPPTASFTTSPAPVQTGQTVTFDASTSVDGDGRVARYEWDLDGDGFFETDTGETPRAMRAYVAVGPVNVVLRVTDDDGVTTDAIRLLRVDPAASPAAPQPPPAPTPTPQAQAPATPPTAVSRAVACRSLKGVKRAACERKRCRSRSRAKRFSCLRKTCRFLKGSPRRTCLLRYASRKR